MDRIDVYDPENYVASAPHAEFEYLRRECPVFRQEMPDGTFYWAILKHADVVEVSRQPLRFSAEVGGVVFEDSPPEQLEQSKNMLLMMDPPKHTTLRRETAPYFKARESSRSSRTRCASSVARSSPRVPRWGRSSSCTTSPPWSRRRCSAR